MSYSHPELEHDPDLDYTVASQLGVNVEDLELCPKVVYDALLRYFHYHLTGGSVRDINH
jgi:hypothetical protein